MNRKTWNWLEYLRDPYHVWKFQQYFGVEKVKMVEHVKNGKFQSKHIDDLKTNNVVEGTVGQKILKILAKKTREIK